MSESLILVTGFGPFEAVQNNPSADVAQALAATPPAELPAGVSVACAVLPTSFARSAVELDAHWRAREPSLLLSLGVQSKGGTSFRLERRAARLLAGRTDIDGREAQELTGGERRTSLDLSRLAIELASAGAHEVTISDDAGGYVCERVYHYGLGRAAEHGVPALFLHLPPEAHVATPQQIEVVARFLPRLARCAGLSPAQ